MNGKQDDERIWGIRSSHTMYHQKRECMFFAFRSQTSRRVRRESFPTFEARTRFRPSPPHGYRFLHYFPPCKHTIPSAFQAPPNLLFHDFKPSKPKPRSPNPRTFGPKESFGGNPALANPTFIPDLAPENGKLTEAPRGHSLKTNSQRTTPNQF